MNRIEDQLSRLFRAAAQVPQRPVPAMPYGLETRALAACCASRTADAGVWDVPLLVRGLIAACAIMVISFFPVLSTTTTTTNPFADFLQLTDTTVSSAESP